MHGALDQQVAWLNSQAPYHARNHDLGMEEWLNGEKEGGRGCSGDREDGQQHLKMGGGDGGWTMMDKGDGLGRLG